MRSDQDIDPKVKFFISNEQRVVNVTLDNVWLRGGRLISPLRYFI